MSGQATVAVEVKVGASEADPHHRKQLEEYRNWLRRQPGKPYLFTLVRDPDWNLSQDLTKLTDGRRTWRGLRTFLSSHRWELEVSNTISSQFCEYLEKELIVTNWKIMDLQSLSSGLKAQRALRAIFESVQERAQSELKLKSKIVPSEEVWWRIELGGDPWNGVFGDGYNYKLFIWYCVAPIWDADEKQEGFAFDLNLWNKPHGNEWGIAKTKLKAWIPHLNKQGFTVYASDTWRSDERPILSIESIGVGIPAMIRAKNPSDEILFKGSQNLTQEQLIGKIFDLVKAYNKLVQSLASA